MTYLPAITLNFVDFSKCKLSKEQYGILFKLLSKFQNLPTALYLWTNEPDNDRDVLLTMV